MAQVVSPTIFDPGLGNKLVTERALRRHCSGFLAMVWGDIRVTISRACCQAQYGRGYEARRDVTGDGFQTAYKHPRAN